MPIWMGTPTLDELNRFSSNTMLDHLDIRFTEIGDDYLVATMPVDHRTIQPLGLLHGGASATLAETLGSTAAMLTVDAEHSQVVGIEINANHIRAVREGIVEGVTRPVHIGKRTQVWQIDVRDERKKLVSVSRLTMAVIERDEL